MKQLTFILLLAMSAINAYALKFEDILFTNGKNNTHYAFWDEVEEPSSSFRNDAKNFIVILDDSIFRKDDDSVNGLIKNDFDGFYHDQEIGTISPLRRKTAEYLNAYNKAKESMNRIRNNCKEGIMYKFADSYDVWRNKHNYDIETGSFTIQLRDIYFKNSETKRMPPTYGISNFSQMISSFDLEKKFNQRPIRLGYIESKQTEPVNKIKIPIANKSVALAIEETTPNYDNGQHIFEFVYIFHLSDFKGIKYSDELTDLPHFEVTDVALIHMPTRQVVWTAMTGDHSTEVTL